MPKVEEPAIEVLYRLGKQNKNYHRVLKVVLKDRKERKKLLENSKNIKDNVEEDLKKVLIVKDLTIVQRKERKTKQEEKAKAKKDNKGEENEVLEESDVASGNNTIEMAPNDVSRYNIETIIDETADTTVVGGIHASQGFNITERDPLVSPDSSRTQCG